MPQLTTRSDLGNGLSNALVYRVCCVHKVFDSNAMNSMNPINAITR